MFTGIVEALGKVTGVRSNPNQMTIEVESPFQDLALGESVSVNGVCLTVFERPETGRAVFYLSGETLARTAFADLKENSRVNLERALPAHGRLSGHIVQGHVDGIGKITRLFPDADAYLLEVAVSPELGRYAVEKGSIAVHGVSLTINRVRDEKSATFLSICLIPHTYKHTVFQELNTDSRVHIEIDVLAKYMERLCRIQDLRIPSPSQPL